MAEQAEDTRVVVLRVWREGSVTRGRIATRELIIAVEGADDILAWLEDWLQEYGGDRNDER